MKGYIEIGAKFAQDFFDYRMSLFEMTHADYTRMKKIVRARCRSLAEQIEDPLLKEFIEEEGQFKPSPEEQHARLTQKAFEDPAMLERMQELEKGLMEGHSHPHDDEIDLKDLNES